MLVRALNRNRIEAVIHMAASSQVCESVENPHLYFTNNISAGVSLLDAMQTVGVKKLVFSSSAAIYSASGASERRGEVHGAATPLIPNTLRVAVSRSGHVDVLGEDYNTPDGTYER